MKPENIKERKAKHKREAVVSVVMFTLLQLATAVCFGALCFIPDVPGWFPVVFGVLAALCLLFIIPAVLLLKTRFQEIEGGELDAAAEY